MDFLDLIQIIAHLLAYVIYGMQNSGITIVVTVATRLQSPAVPQAGIPPAYKVLILASIRTLDVAKHTRYGCYAVSGFCPMF